MGRAISTYQSNSPHGRGQQSATKTRISGGKGFPEISSLIDPQNRAGVPVGRRFVQQTRSSFARSAIGRRFVDITLGSPGIGPTASGMTPRCGDVSHGWPAKPVYYQGRISIRMVRRGIWLN